jgi:hypothetical protein
LREAKQITRILLEHGAHEDMTAHGSEEDVDAHDEDVLLNSSSDSWSNAATTGWNTSARHLAATRLDGVYVLPLFLISFLAEADSVVVGNPGWPVWTQTVWEG